MLEFFKLIRSLFFAVVNYFYNNYIGVLRKHYSSLANCLFKKQRLFIIVPLSVAFIVSYPSLYTIWNGGWTDNGFGYRTDLRFVDGSHEGGNPLDILQVWLKSDNCVDTKHRFDITSPEALNKDFLRKVWRFQNDLLDGIIPKNDNKSINNNDDDNDNNDDTNTNVFIHSPFEFWDNNLDVFENDNNLLKTINNKNFKSSTSGQTIINDGLFGDVVKVNGLIKSAKLIRIAMLVPKNSNYVKVWNSNLLKYKMNENNNNSTSDFKIVDQLIDDEKHFALKISKMNSIDHFILSLCYSLIAIYFLVSLINFNPVRSKLGLLIGFIVQIFLSILSSATLTSYFYHGVDFHQIPLQFLPFIVIVVSIENTFRLVTSISNTKKELTTQHKLSDALTESGLTSTLIIMTDCFIFFLVYPHVSKGTQEFLVFVSFALIIDHVLHLTFFTSILSIDLHRLELSDLLNDTNDDEDLLESYSNDKPNESFIQRFTKKIKTVYSKIKLPFSTTVWGTTVVTVALILMNIRWSNDSLTLFHKSSQIELNHSLDYDYSYNDLNEFLNRNGLNDEILSLVNFSEEKILIDLPSPSLFVLNKNDVNSQFPDHFNTHVSYTFDIYYILEFLALLIFILSIASLVLTYFTKNLTFHEDEFNKNNLITEDSFQVKILSGGHFLDIIKTSTSNSSFIASIGLDHKVLIWSPVSKPLLKPTQLPITSQLWPIINVVISDSGNFITIFSKNGIVQCWSRLTMTWVWKFEIPELKKNNPLETFFRYKTIPAFLQRKRAAANKLSQADELLTRSRRNSLRSISSPKLNPTNTFSNNVGINTDISEDFIVVLKTGILLTISCQDQNNSISREKLNNSSLISSSKLITPRVNDRLVSYTKEGNILVSTAVNNKWKTRTINVIQNTFNNPIRLITPPQQQPSIPVESLPENKISKTQIAIVPFVGFMVKTDDSFAELIDVQTGMLIKKFKIDPLIKQKSLKVFHDQPTHCRFCGSASIASFSIAYSLANSRSLVMHTFKVDHRAKTSICLRVERDPREIRCVGFNQVTEHIYHVDDIEGWCCNGQNEIMGLKKKPESEIIESIEKFKKDSVLRHRRNKPIHNNSINHPVQNHSSRLYNLWEGWKINADGKFEIFKIPDIGNSEGLLVNSIGEINKFGHKSIVVVFGNIMKVLYLGNDELIYHDDKQKNNSSSTNEEINGLSFINKRRILNKNKYSEKLNSSSNFNEFDANPASLPPELPI